jgi:hypothetical protein
MEEPLVVWRWSITDERTGKRRLTKWHMTEQDALERYPDAVREQSSREERHSPGSADPSRRPRGRSAHRPALIQHRLRNQQRDRQWAPEA